MYALNNLKRVKPAGVLAKPDGGVSTFCSHSEFGRRSFRSLFSKAAQVVSVPRHRYRLEEFHFVSRTRRKGRET